MLRNRSAHFGALTLGSPLCALRFEDAESANASEIAVYGKKPGGSLAGYFVPPPGSSVETLVKAIARIDA